MTQERLNHLMVLHVHKPLTELLDLVQVANSFVNKSISSLYLVNFVALILSSVTILNCVVIFKQHVCS